MGLAVLGFLGGVKAQSLTDDLGDVEQRALDRALTLRKLTIDPSPEGKAIGTIHVVNLDVFQPKDDFLQFFNAFHITTLEVVIRREVLLQPGDPWNEQKVFETKRNLRVGTFTTAVVAVPVVNGDPDLVDLLVVTRDVWSLRLNNSINFQQDTIQQLGLSLSENNFLGRRKRISAQFNMDLGSIFLGGSYFDSNIAGSRLTFFHGSGVILSRESGDPEGSSSNTEFGLPLWALDRKWGFALRGGHSFSVARSFVGTDLRTYDNPDTPVVESVPRVFDDRQVSAELIGTRSFPGWMIHRVSLGYSVTYREVEGVFSEDVDAETRAAFERDVLPRTENRSGVVLRYALFRPKFRIYRNIQSMDFPEDRRVGPSLSVGILASPTTFGSTEDLLLLDSSVSWFFDWSDDAYSVVSASTAHRYEAEGLVDNSLSASLFSASPTLWSIGRWILSFRGRALVEETSNRFLSAGGDAGLRGFPVGQFTGEQRLLVNAEFRTRSINVWFLKFGAVAFYDGGHAWGDRPGLPTLTTAANLDWQSNVGFGIRYLVPQTETTVWRVDLAFPLTGPTAGFEGTRFSFALGQFF